VIAFDASLFGFDRRYVVETVRQDASLLTASEKKPHSSSRIAGAYKLDILETHTDI